MSVIAIPQTLTDKLGRDAANALVDVLNKVEEGAKEVTLEVAESRFEKRLAEFETRIEQRLSKFEADLIKWMIGISITQMALILTIISVFLRK